MIVYEYVEGGAGVISGWGLESEQRRKLKNKIRFLRNIDCDLAAGTYLHKTKVEGIWECEIKGRVQLRPMACFGPVEGEEAVTFLAVAKEVGWRLVPRNVREIAASRLACVRADSDAYRRDVWPLIETAW